MTRRCYSYARPVLAIATVLVLGGAAAACGDDEAKDTTTTTTAASTSDSEKAPLPKVSDVWARPGTTGGNSAIYMSITAGAEEDHLVKAAVPSDVVGTVELHETTTSNSGDTGDTGGSSTTAMTDSGGDGSTTTMGGDMMGMKQVDEITIDADTTLVLKPGGYHVMLIDLKQDLKVGDTIPVTLTFEHSGDLKTTATVRES